MGEARRNATPRRCGAGSTTILWERVSLTTYVGSDAPVRWKVGGQLTYDGFGSCRVHIERHEGVHREALLDFSGVEIIDPAKDTIQFEEVERRADSTGALP